MEDIPHTGRNMVKFRYPTNWTGSRAQNAVEAIQASSRETNVRGTTVVEPGSDKGIIITIISVSTVPQKGSRGNQPIYRSLIKTQSMGFGIGFMKEQCFQD